jgi:hypothetical protein
MASIVSVPFYATPLDTRALHIALEDSLLSTVEGMLEDYEATTATWEHAVEFDFEVEIGENFTAVVGTNDQIYEWVNRGTGQAAGNRADWYPIPTAPTGVAYQSAFRPKTQPGVLSSRAGGKSGPTDVIRAQVFHPGIEPRLFDEEIEAKWQARFQRDVERTLDNFYRSQRRFYGRL